MEGEIENLLVGKRKSYIRCINVDYESSTVDKYYDIQLNVEGCATLRDSFIQETEVEILEGENQYQAEGYGMQDARKGEHYQSFPPVLHLHLRRFKYDYNRDAMVKVSNFFSQLQG